MLIMALLRLPNSQHYIEESPWLEVDMVKQVEEMHPAVFGKWDLCRLSIPLLLGIWAHKRFSLFGDESVLGRLVNRLNGRLEVFIGEELARVRWLLVDPILTAESRLLLLFRDWFRRLFVDLGQQVVALQTNFDPFVGKLSEHFRDVLHVDLFVVLPSIDPFDYL